MFLVITNATLDFGLNAMADSYTTQENSWKYVYRNFFYKTTRFIRESLV